MRNWTALGVALLFLVTGATSQHRVARYKQQSGVGSVRIIDGDVARRGQFPHQVGLYIDYTGFCGGSLIHERWVLTAGHCVDGATLWFAYLGAENMLLPKEADRKVYVTRNVYPHPNYEFPYIDIALLRLNQDVKFTDYIQPIALPTSTDASYVGQTAIISGWGRTSDENSHTASNLRYVDLTVVDIRVCQTAYGDQRIASALVCTQGENIKATCQGDSGGPLVVNGEEGYTLIGATSFGSTDGCESEAPNGFASVAYFLPWISNTTGLPFI